MTYRLYDIINDGRAKDVPVIECLLCGGVIAYLNDIAHNYCGACHLFHDAVAEARRLHASGATHECNEWPTARADCAICGVPVERRGER
jgi:predicted sulfurtransferase